MSLTGGFALLAWMCCVIHLKWFAERFGAAPARVRG
jgi:hypothetical protein